MPRTSSSSTTSRSRGDTVVRSSRSSQSTDPDSSPALGPADATGAGAGTGAANVPAKTARLLTAWYCGKRGQLQADFHEKSDNLISLALNPNHFALSTLFSRLERPLVRTRGEPSPKYHSEPSRHKGLVFFTSSNEQRLLIPL